MEKTKIRNRPRRAMVRGMDGVYHLLSRTSCRQYLFGDEEKEMFVRLMRRQAEFCGVDVLAYCVMSNHFHILARVRYGGVKGVSPRILTELAWMEESNGMIW